MAKKKKKSPKNGFANAFKPFLKNNQMLLTVLGAAAGGAALAVLIGSDKARKVIDDLTVSVKDLMQRDGYQAADTKVTKVDLKKPSPAAAT